MISVSVPKTVKRIPLPKDLGSLSLLYLHRYGPSSTVTIYFGSFLKFESLHPIAKTIVIVMKKCFAFN